MPKHCDNDPEKSSERLKITDKVEDPLPDFGIGAVIISIKTPFKRIPNELKEIIRQHWLDKIQPDDDPDNNNS